LAAKSYIAFVNYGELTRTSQTLDCVPTKVDPPPMDETLHNARLGIDFDYIVGDVVVLRAGLC